jgi:hypothetical protein
MARARGASRAETGSLDGLSVRELPRQTPTDPESNAGPMHYAYKASLIGSPRRFELTEKGLSWRLAGRSGLWPYARIASVRLSYRPVSMQSRRFRADLETVDGLRLRIFSTSWQTASLMAPQDHGYRAFIIELHRRMCAAGSPAMLSGGLRPRLYAVAAGLLMAVAVLIAALLLRALLTGAWAGGLFLAGFAALFAYQVGGFVRRNRPRRYRFDDLPAALLP